MVGNKTSHLLHKLPPQKTNATKKRPSTAKSFKGDATRSDCDIRPGTAEQNKAFMGRAKSFKTGRFKDYEPESNDKAQKGKGQYSLNVRQDSDTLSGDNLYSKAKIVVCIRKRPLTKGELDKSETDVLSVINNNTMMVHEPKLKVDLTKYVKNHVFKFDHIFDETSSNEMVYKVAVKPLLENVFLGGVSTCFAYGQTGSGKTYTMSGSSATGKDYNSEGMYARTANDFFQMLGRAENKKRGFSVTVSFYEIYGEKLYDLLANRFPLRICEDFNQEVNIIGLSEWLVKSESEVKSLLVEGNMARSSGRTNRNMTSSRSHAVFQIRLMIKEKMFGKFNLIDLAGNEKTSSFAAAQSKFEGAEINKSLLALKECIRALVLRKMYLPFRASKLTQVLRDSFVGDHVHTCMIAMTSPGAKSTQNTLNTLRYAHRVKDIWKRPASTGSCSEAEPNIKEQKMAPTKSGDTSRETPWLPDSSVIEEFSRYLRNGAIWTRKETELYSSFRNGALQHSLPPIKKVLLERILHTEMLLSLMNELSINEK